MKTPKISWIGAVLAASIVTSLAQPVLTLDPTFNPIITRPGGRVASMVVQDDGRIYVAGAFGAIDGVPRKGVARLNAAGGLDPSFYAVMPAEEIEINTAELQPDGKVVLGGRFFSHDDGGRYGIIRLNPDGSRDAGFRPYRTGNLPLLAMALQSDSRIVFGYLGYEANRPVRHIRRLHPSGDNDLSFQPAVLEEDSPGGLAVQADDKIVVWGCFTKINGAQHLGLARLNADGTIDSTFRHNLQSEFPEHPWICFSAVTLLPDGGLIASGYFNGENLVRLHSDGSVDLGLRGGVSASILLQPDGRMIVTYGSPYGEISRLRSDGYSDDTFQPLQEGRAWVLLANGDVLIEHESQVKRLKPDGTLDSSFAATALEVPGSVGAIIQQPDGKIVFTGQFSRVNGVPREGIARLKVDGSLDSSFVPGPEVPDFWSPFGDFPDFLGILRYQPWDGKLLVAGLPGWDPVGQVPQSSLVRLNPDGSLDPSFTADFPPAPGGFDLGDAIIDLALQSDGKLFVARYGAGESTNRLVRLNTDGSFDGNFNWQGTLSHPRTIALQSDGNLIVGGLDATNLIARLHPDGSADTNFAPSLPDSWAGGIMDILVQQDGKIVVVDHVFDEGNVVIRLNPDGTRDASFGSTATPSEVWLFNRVDGAVLTEENGLVVFGDIHVIDDERLFGDDGSANLVFLNANGQFEGKAGRLKKPYWDPRAYALTWALLPLSDGGLLVAGPIARDNSLWQSDLVRLRPVPIIQSIRFHPAGEVSLSIGGESGWTYRIETSTDLVNWTPLREVASAGAITQFQDAAPASQTRRFYRAALKP